MHHITCDVLCAGINNQQEWGTLTHERELNMFDRAWLGICNQMPSQ